MKANTANTSPGLMALICASFMGNYRFTLKRRIARERAHEWSTTRFAGFFAYARNRVEIVRADNHRVITEADVPAFMIRLFTLPR